MEQIPDGYAGLEFCIVRAAMADALPLCLCSHPLQDFEGLTSSNAKIQLNSTPGKETFSESRRCDTYLVLKASFRDKDSLYNEISGWHMWQAKEENSLYKKVSTCQPALEERNRKGHSNILPRLRSPSTNFGNV